MVNYKLVNSIEEIEQIEKIERKYYDKNALTVDILSPIANITGFIIGAYEKEKIIGYTAFSKSQQANSMHCLSLIVESDYRQQGIGSDLIHEAEKRCLLNNIKEVTATASPSNIPSCKTFLNSSNWSAIEVYKDLYGKDKYSLFLTKDITNHKPIISKINKNASLSEPEVILDFLNRGYIGKRIVSDSTMTMFTNKRLSKKIKKE